MEDHQKRVISELKALATKTSALSKFIGDNPIFPSLATEEQADLRLQCAVMGVYREVLERRISRFS